MFLRKRNVLRDPRTEKKISSSDRVPVGHTALRAPDTFSFFLLIKMIVNRSTIPINPRFLAHLMEITTCSSIMSHSELNNVKPSL